METQNPPNVCAYCGDAPPTLSSFEDPSRLYCNVTCHKNEIYWTAFIERKNREARAEWGIIVPGES